MNYFNRVKTKDLNTIPRSKYLQHFKKLAIILLMMLSFTEVFSQQPAKKETPPPLPTRQISGIVKDSTDLGVIGATVSLTSDKDTLRTSTNSDGIFIFKDVKSATYTLVIQSIGYEKSPVMRFKQNDMIPRIVMDPIMLKEQKNTLNEVVINGTPSITYKTDTVEYKASDYVVRKNATVDELLKKMEGMEVGTDGSLVHQGETVAKAKLNGKEYLGGDIANAIKNLPAEIVDKIQIVDDYGDQAARTGVKDGDPQKVLNITTRTDKSVGNMMNMNAAGGSNERKEAGLFTTRINGNQQMGLNGNYKDVINLNALDGSNKNADARFSLRDKIGKKIEYNLNYNFTNSNGDNLNETESLSILTDGQLFSRSSSTGLQKSKNHDFKLEFEVNLDSNDYLKVIPTFKYGSNNNNTGSTSSQRGSDISMGLDQDRKVTNSNSRTAPDFGISAFYQHTFKKYRRNFSTQIDLNKDNQDNEQERYNFTTYYLENSTTKDSVLNQIIARKNLRDNYRGSMTYVEPLGVNTQFEVNAQVNYNGYDNTATTRNILTDGLSDVVDSLSNIYNYSFTQGRIALNFRYGMANTSKVRFSVGLTGVPALLSGTKLSLGTTTNRSSFNLIPIARFEYRWSRQQKVSLNYSGNAVEPTFDQIQPVRDVTNPNNPIIGNPDLLATFVHTLRGDYNNYIANSKLNFSLNANGSYTENAVIRNNQRVDNPDPALAGSKINETRFLNVSGVYRLTGNYNISKQLNNRKYNLQLNGTASYNHNLSMRDGILNTTDITVLEQRFGPKINPTEWFEINANIGYRNEKSNSTLPGANNNINTLSLNLDGRVYLWESWMLAYNGSKQYIDGIVGNTNNRPLVINASLERQLFNRRGQITFQAFDILNQNNYLRTQQPEDGGYINTSVNPMSRYFMLKLSMRLQKWSGAQGRGGRGIMRRGDGSFM
ncbi:outer membrane beta-barrel protein [Pedobacter nyackensis]|uniref:CarboxypepD_reg-like domain-containing protein n=1 Tax=Pedobacter nyackensis TaxID=475255 RepID=A0A1W2ACB2_9SPHI|nr:outer membrane beta-barrel protein [Pedobacter nyackensis]SMC58296.1 CarboxypepD_reg-like domain-containing protein [Pedobacter nyackensis]